MDSYFCLNWCREADATPPTGERKVYIARNTSPGEYGIEELNKDDDETNAFLSFYDKYGPKGNEEDRKAIMNSRGYSVAYYDLREKQVVITQPSDDTKHWELLLYNANDTSSKIVRISYWLTLENPHYRFVVKHWLSKDKKALQDKLNETDTKRERNEAKKLYEDTIERETLEKNLQDVDVENIKRFMERQVVQNALTNEIIRRYADSSDLAYKAILEGNNKEDMIHFIMDRWNAYRLARAQERASARQASLAATRSGAQQQPARKLDSVNWIGEWEKSREESQKVKMGGGRGYKRSKSMKRKSMKRKSMKRKSMKRKSMKRKSMKRKSMKRKSMKRTK
jgi:hypothetical protein